MVICSIKAFLEIFLVNMSIIFVFTGLYEYCSCFISIDRVMKYLPFLLLLRAKYCRGNEVVYVDRRSILITLESKKTLERDGGECLSLNNERTV